MIRNSKIKEATFKPIASQEFQVEKKRCRYGNR